MAEDYQLTLRTFLAIKTMERTDCHWTVAFEAVSSTLLDFPEWSLTERRTFPEWERELEQRRITLPPPQ